MIPLQLSWGVSNCLESQAGMSTHVVDIADQRCAVRAIVFRIVKSFRMQAIRASFLDLPLATKRW